MDHDGEAKPAPQKRPGGGRRGDTRELGRVVRRYLGALEASRSSRGKKRTIEGFSARLLKIDELLVSADPLARLHLTQERIDLHAELVRVTNAQDPDLSAIEKEFVRVARQYGELAGITFAAWRQVGVDAEVLDQAGIVRTATPRPDASRVRRTTEVGVDTDAPLLPRTEPIAEVAPEPAIAPDRVSAPAPEPELALEGLEVTTAPAPSPAPAPARPKTSLPPPPPRPKGPKPKAAAAPAAESAPAPAPADGQAPKLRRKRIAD